MFLSFPPFNLKQTHTYKLPAPCQGTIHHDKLEQEQQPHTGTVLKCTKTHLNLCFRVYLFIFYLDFTLDIYMSVLLVSFLFSPARFTFLQTFCLCLKWTNGQICLDWTKWQSRKRSIKSGQRSTPVIGLFKHTLLKANYIYALCVIWK